MAAQPELNAETLRGLLMNLRAMYSHRGDGMPTQHVNPDGWEAARVIEAILDANTKLTEERDALAARVAELKGIVARVRQAIAYVPPEDASKRDAAIEADRLAGMSLRQVAAKHGVGVGVVRGIEARGPERKRR